MLRVILPQAEVCIAYLLAPEHMLGGKLLLMYIHFSKLLNG